MSQLDPRLSGRKPPRNGAALGIAGRTPGRQVPCLIGLEACGGTHYWARELQKLGHDVRLMAVAMIQPYRTNQKNNQNDAEAILLGCAGFAQFATELEGDLHIPVLDGVVCAVKMAEAIVELGKTTSKYKTYRLPEGKAFSGMFAKFGRP